MILTDDSHPGYTVYLIDLQWRWGDPLDVYLIKPVGVKKPPVNAKPEEKQAYKDFVERRLAFFERRDQFENLFRQVVREGIERKSFRAVDVGIFTKTMLGAHNWVGVWYKAGGRLDGAEIAEMMADSFLRALKN